MVVYYGPSEMTTYRRRFYKLTGSGNDFVFVDARTEPAGRLEDARVVAAVCARGTGIGADGIVFIEPPANHQERFSIRYLNRDGSLALLCGNASLCSVRLAAELGIVASGEGFVFGTGAIRGVYLQGNEAVAPIFREWMEPFKNLGMTTVSIRNTGGTDHLSYDAVGLPGFQFIQDEVEYNSRTHHSNMDVYERIQANDMMRNAVIVASFVYNAANREEKLPRKPLPRPTSTAGRSTSQD